MTMHLIKIDDRTSSLAYFLSHAHTHVMSFVRKTICWFFRFLKFTVRLSSIPARIRVQFFSKRARSLYTSAFHRKLIFDKYIPSSLLL